MSALSFAHHRPQTLDEALELLARFGSRARAIAGGTDLLPQLRAGRLAVEHVVSLNRIERLRGVSFDPAEGLVIGAGARLSSVGAHPVVAQRYAALAQAAAVMATCQIRNMGTVAGNLANGSPCADTASPLLVHDAYLTVAGQGGVRKVPLDGFARGGKRVDLRAGEVIVSIHAPPPAGAVSCYLRLSARSRVDMAAVGVAGLVALDDTGRVARARLALTAVAPTHLRVQAAERVLLGELPVPELLAQAAAICAAAARPIDDVRATAAWRRHVVGVLARRALHRCVDAAQGDDR